MLRIQDFRDQILTTEITEIARNNSGNDSLDMFPELSGKRKLRVAQVPHQSCGHYTRLPTKSEIS